MPRPNPAVVILDSLELDEREITSSYEHFTAVFFAKSDGLLIKRGRRLRIRIASSMLRVPIFRMNLAQPRKPPAHTSASGHRCHEPNSKNHPQSFS